MSVVVRPILDAINLLSLGEGEDLQLLNLSTDKVEHHDTSFNLTVELESADKDELRYVEYTLGLSESTH